MNDRTPVITVELQLRPHVPENAVPWWYGNHRLRFEHQGREVWDGTIEYAEAGSRSALVRPVEGFGWVLELRFTHEKARQMLAGKWPSLPEFVEGAMAGGRAS